MPSGFEGELEGEAGAAQAAQLEPPADPVEGRMREKEERLERHQRPLELAAFGEIGRRLAGEQRPWVDAARDGVELRTLGPQPAHHFGGGEAGKVADRRQPPAGERLAQPELGREPRQRQGRQEAGFTTGRDDAWISGVGAIGASSGASGLRGHLRGQLAAGDADPRRESRAPGRGGERTAELALRRPVRCGGRGGAKAPGEAVGIEEENPRSGDLDARREALGDLGERLLGGAFAGAVAIPRRELWHQRPRLNERHAGGDAEAAGGTGGGDDLRCGTVAGGHGERLRGELRLGPQARGEREERHPQAGEAAHAGSARRSLSPCGARRRWALVRVSRPLAPSRRRGAAPVPLHRAWPRESSSTVEAAGPATR